MVRDNQTIFDIAVEKYGDLEYSSDLISLNRVSFDGDLSISDTLVSDEEGKGDEEIKKSFKELNYKPVND